MPWHLKNITQRSKEILPLLHICFLRKKITERNTSMPCLLTFSFKIVGCDITVNLPSFWQWARFESYNRIKRQILFSVCNPQKCWSPKNVYPKKLFTPKSLVVNMFAWQRSARTLIRPFSFYHPVLGQVNNNNNTTKIVAYLSCSSVCTHFAQTNADQRSFLFPQTDWSLFSFVLAVYLATDWLVPVIQTARTMLQNIVSVHIHPCLPGQCQRGRNRYPCNYSTWIQAAKLPVLTVYRVGFAQSWSSNTGPLGGVHSLGPPRPGNPVGGNGMHTRLMGPSHRVVGRAVNWPLPGPPGLSYSYSLAQKYI